MNKDVLLNTEQMAKFVANGFLEFDGLVDQKTNKEVPGAGRYFIPSCHRILGF